MERTKAYQKWRVSPDHGSLWMKAIAGAGKSVIAATIAAELAQGESVPVLFFFSYVKLWQRTTIGVSWPEIGW